MRQDREMQILICFSCSILSLRLAPTVQAYAQKSLERYLRESFLQMKKILEKYKSQQLKQHTGITIPIVVYFEIC